MRAHWALAVRSNLAAVTVAAAAAGLLAGCGKGGGGSSPTASLAPTTPTPTPAIGNSFFVTMTDPKEQPNGSPIGKITSVSPTTGSQLTATVQRGNWSVADPLTIPKDDNGNQQWIVAQYNSLIAQNPNLKIYQRTGTNDASLTSGPSGKPTASGSTDVTDYYLSNCAPGASGNCQVFGTMAMSNENFTATQNGVKVTESTVQPGTVNIKNSWISIDQNTSLQYVQTGKASTADLNYTVSATDGGNWQKLPNGLFFSPQGVGTQTEGHFFTGTPTSTADMTSLKQGTNQVTAVYSGQFQGTELTDTTRRGLSGQTTVNANFGAGTITGTVSNMQAYSNCDGSCTQAAASYNLNMVGTITGNQYKGTTQYANPTTGSATGPGTGLSGTGNLVGGFFGPSAAETGGAVRVNGAAPGVAGTNTTVTGAYSAKKP
jgi:C-lobe and N-lobe beta barrels of Tf-binding protein B